MNKPPNYLDFLVAFDDHIQAGNLAYVISGHELFGIAHAAGLTGPNPVRLGSAGVGDAVVADAREFMLGPHPSRRKGLAVTSTLWTVDDVAVVDELAHPLNDHPAP